MQYEITKGFLMLMVGAIGMLATLIAAVVAAIVIRKSRKNVQKKLDEEYKV